MEGRVVSTKLKNTATVLVERIVTHPLYKKTFTRSKRYLVDDSMGVKEGDIVDFIKVKPISKNKHWKIDKVVGQNLVEITKESLKKGAEKIIAEVMPEEKETVDSNEQLKQPADKKEEKEKKEVSRTKGLSKK